MTTPTELVSEIYKLAPESVIELFILDATAIGGEVFRFHAGTNHLKSDVIWNGNTYVRYPVEATEFELNGQGQFPRPRLRVSNIFSSITSLLLLYDDLLGAMVTRKRTLAKFLDAANFPGGVNPSASPTSEFAEDVFYIDRKSSEDRDTVEFELASSIDLAGQYIPKRQVIQNICIWKYRSAECSYADPSSFTYDDRPTANPALDVCGKRLSSCKARFGEANQLPFGGFPAAELS